MTTLNEMIEIITAENIDGIQVGNDQDGYTPFTAAQYKAQIAEWAAARLDKLAKLAEINEKLVTRQAVLDKLGLTQDEANALFG